MYGSVGVLPGPTTSSSGAPSAAPHEPAAASDAAASAFRFVLRRPRPDHSSLADVMSKPYWWARGADAPPSTAKALLHPLARFGPGLMFTAIASLVYSSRFGSESLVRAGGPLPAIVGVALVPWLWFGPTALAVAELATAVPSNAGPQMWANVGLGTLWAFFTSYLTLFINVLVLAAASAVFADYVGMTTPLAPWANLLVRAGVLVCSAVLNGVSVDGVTWVLYAVTVVSLVPFVIMPIWQFFFTTEGAQWDAMRVVGSPFQIPLFMTFLSFTHEGVENVGAVVEETIDPARSLRLVLLPCILLSHVVYLFPIMAGVSAYAAAGLAATHGYAPWVSGYWSTIANLIGGHRLELLMLVSGIAARFGASISAGAAGGRMLAGMGTLDALPSSASDFLAQYHPFSSSPVNAVVVLTALSLPVALQFQSDELLALSQVFIATRLLVIYATFVAMRLRYPTLRRPFRFPCRGTGAAVMALSPSIAFSAGVVAASAFLNAVVCIVAVVALTAMLAGAALSARFFRPNGLYGTVEPDELSTWEVEEQQQVDGPPRSGARVALAFRSTLANHRASSQANGSEMALLTPSALRR